MIEAVSPTVHEHDATRAPRDRRVDRKLEIGRVLLSGMAIDRRTRRDRGVDLARIGGVEIADEKIHVQTETFRDTQSGVGGDDVGVGRQPPRRCGGTG